MSSTKTARSIRRRPVHLTQHQARHIWMKAQRLTETAPFGAGPEAVAAAVAHLGYVQIDTINVIERCHHHILFSRIPGYRRDDLAVAQSADKSVFEYWTHALSYIPADDFRFFVGGMKALRKHPDVWGANVTPYKLRKVLKRVREEGALTISDINDEKLVEKNHPWASRKPSKAALQRGFWNGQLVVSARTGMLKTYDLTERHFGWDRLPKPATERQKYDYLLDRALRSQGIVSLDSICHLSPRQKPEIRELIERRVRARKLRPVAIGGIEKAHFWAAPETLETDPPVPGDLVHILSPFDPLIIQRKRTSALFNYDHLFEAYLPAGKRQWGYFSLPVLVGDEIVAAIDIKADRQNGALLIQNWTWMAGAPRTRAKPLIETALHRFEQFQFDRRPD